jgi:hypothetical protein
VSPSPFLTLVAKIEQPCRSRNRDSFLADLAVSEFFRAQRARSSV